MSAWPEIKQVMSRARVTSPAVSFLTPLHTIMMLQPLPAKIQLLIAQQLENRDKAALVLTSQHFYKLVTPSLYKNIDNTYNRELMRLVDTLARTPLLRAFPRTLTLEAWDPSEAEPPGDLLVDPHEEELDSSGFRIGLLCRLAEAACPFEVEARL
ncbi:hypothetical protein BJX68DRAFT_246064 [Aspergillus pseudodeflectus]|uniref:F-box domain-containing protein n=1 Tax=Aspergillus pseudodeflectus TaxID=176178 RepID=A0ABR4JLJ9_9EURO